MPGWMDQKCISHTHTHTHTHTLTHTREREGVGERIVEKEGERMSV